MALQAEIEKLTTEIDELNRLIGLTSVPSVKSYLQERHDSQTRKRAIYLKDIENASKQTPTTDGQLGQILLKNYAWDQTEAAVKIYVNNDKAEKIDQTQVSLKFTSPRSFTCIFGKYRLTLANLHSAVDESKSSAKITSSNRLIITLIKEDKKNWADIQSKSSTFNPPNIDKDTDPQQSIMNLMQKMYEEGDDEMKRTIKKSMYEANQKRGPELDGLSGLGKLPEL